MKNDGIEKEEKDKIIALILALVPDAKIYLFGSRARGTQSKWSDIDIALDTGNNIPRGVLGELMSIFEATNLWYKIQILDINSVDDVMKKAILEDRVIWKT